jgi:hypothetical protein
MERCSFAAFAAAARATSDEARRQGLLVPAFRTPPRPVGAHRTLRRRRDGGAVVAVRVRGRTTDDVLADLIEGVVAANRLGGDGADECRAALRDALASILQSPPYPNWQRAGT